MPIGLEPIELKDRLSVVILLALIPVCSALPIEKTALLRSKTILVIFEIAAIAITMISISWMTYYRPESPKTMWEGFGLSVAATTSILAVLVYLFRQNRSLVRVTSSIKHSRICLILITLLLAVSYFPSIMSFPNGITAVWSMRWSLNELIAPLAGTFPLFNFTSQYSSLLGYPLLILKFIAPKELWPLFVLMYVNLLIFLQFLLMGNLIKKVFPKVSFIICLFVPCSISLVQLPMGRNPSSSIIASLTATPSRTFLPILALTFCVYWAINRKMVYAIITGFACGLTAINNLEFGIWFTLILSAVAFASYLKILHYFDRKSIRSFFYALILTNGAFFIGSALISKPYDYRRHIIFLRAFGKDGFGNIPMPLFGLFVFVFTMLALTAVMAMRLSYELRNQAHLEQGLSVAILIGLIIGPWSILSLLYYAGRSTNAGQLQIFLIPLSLCIFAIIRMTLYEFRGSLDFRQIYLHSPVFNIFLLVLPFSLILQAPNPLAEINRWTNSPYQWTLEGIRTSDVGISLTKFQTENPTKQIGYFGNNGNLMEISIGIENLGTINFPYDLWMSPLIYDLACKDLQSNRGYQLLVPVADLPENEVQGFCTAYGTTYTGLDPTGLLHVYDLN
jgi:hypothetical protein